MCVAHSTKVSNAP